MSFINLNFISIAKILMFVTALSIDTFIASFAYGANKIRIPPLSNILINVICSTILGISLFMGSAVGNYIPEKVTSALCFLILFILGLIKLFDSYIKSYIKRKENIGINFSLFNLNFILKVYAKPEDADIDFSKDLSPSESISLAIALSMDGLAAGFGAGITEINYIIVIAMFFIINMAALFAGFKIGNKISDNLKMNLSWLSGALLIILAFNRF